MGKIQKQFLTLVILGSGFAFMASTVILFAGLMPTIAANLIDKSRQKSKAICVGVMNFAGCLPFLLELWLGPAPNSVEAATAIIMQPKTMVIIYVIAACGYAVERAVTGMVAQVMQQRARARLRSIDVQLAELVSRWDDYVDGSQALDDFGFPERRD